MDNAAGSQPVTPPPSPQCCVASRRAADGGADAREPDAARIVPAPAPPEHDDVMLPGGRFLMGDTFGEGYHRDGEVPVHQVELAPFSIDRTCVTVAAFARFVEATGYRTEAEQFGGSAVFHLAVEADREDIEGIVDRSWWLAVRGASWRNPYGRKSGIEGLMDHPVVHVSHNDALAYCRWSGRSLPTEAQWEYAARGGHTGLRFPWGNELEQGGIHHANVWQGAFPHRNTLADGWLTTAPARWFEPNSFGLFQMAGNVWEWCADWFSPYAYERSPLRDPQGPSQGHARVVRGGSYLCHDSYCNRYRVAARGSNTPESSTGNLGFRTVRRP